MELVFIAALTASLLLNLIVLAILLQTKSEIGKNAHENQDRMANLVMNSQAVQEQRLYSMKESLEKSMEQLYRGLGEMQNLAQGVGDLKKVLSNVKTRGIFGEIQLGAILEEVLSPEQYEKDIATVRGSRDRVEFAIKLPGDGETPVYLPIDAKFPADLYARLSDAYETGDPEQIREAAKELERRIKQEAKTIREKYVYPPDTTDFAIMFLPVEGLYAEVVKFGLVEVLQRDYKVNIAGPTTMAALLSSLQMGFQTLAVQKHSSEVWQVLGAVKTEFDNFADSLDKARERVSQAGKELDYLMGTRSNVIRQKLKSVQSLSREDADRIFQNDREF